MLAEQLRTVADETARLADLSPTTATVAELGPLLVRLEHAQNLLAGIAADWTATFDTAGGPDQHGAPSLTVWCRRELRITPAETRRRTRRADTLDALPGVRAAFVAGRFGVAALDQIGLGLHQMGPDTITAVEPILLHVAETCDADAVRATIRKTRDTLDPDAADAAYLRALERRDVTVTQVGEGFDIRGYLDPATGAAFKSVLYSHAGTTSADDDRAAGQRRVDALHDLSISWMEHGLPTDRGLRPHLYVTVPAERLNTTTQDLPPAGEPALLHGFGDISDRLLSQLACDATITPVTVDPTTGHVLDVGRTQRLATLKQRQAIFVQQAGVCYNPGCDRTRLEIHHMTPWSAGGRTDMADLRGYCTRCHHLIHLGLLIVQPDDHGGWTHRTKHREYLPQHKRRAANLTRIYLQALTHAGKAHALKATQHYRQGRGHTIIRT